MLFDYISLYMVTEQNKFLSHEAKNNVNDNFPLSSVPETIESMLLPSANEVCEGYVFTCVCLSTGGV